MMKISIELHKQTYTFESDHDGLDIDEITTNFKGLLVAAGFHPQCVDQAILTDHCWFHDQDESTSMNHPCDFSNKHDQCTNQ